MLVTVEVVAVDVVSVAVEVALVNDTDVVVLVVMVMAVSVEAVREVSVKENVETVVPVTDVDLMFIPPPHSQHASKCVLPKFKKSSGVLQSL